MMKKLFPTLLAILSLLLLSTAQAGAPVIDRIADPQAPSPFAEGAELLEIIFPNVWDEDAAIIRCGGQVMLLDCAKEHHGSRVAGALKQFGIDRIDWVVNSHPHNDHLLGLKTIASSVEIGQLLFCFPEKETEHMAVAIKTADKHQIPVGWFEDGHQFAVGGAVIDVWLKGDADWTLNERSAQMRLQFGEATMLFTADMMQKTQRRLLEVIEPSQLDVDIFKYPHHGLTLPDLGYFEAVSPAYVIITNTAGDRTQKVRSFLNQRGVPWATTSPGYVTLTTDGTAWLVERIPLEN